MLMRNETEQRAFEDDFLEAVVEGTTARQAYVWRNSEKAIPFNDVIQILRNSHGPAHGSLPRLSSGRRWSFSAFGIAQVRDWAEEAGYVFVRDGNCTRVTL